MSWRDIAEAFKRLDDRLSDAVYVHGRYLAGQEKIIHPHPRFDAAIKRLQPWLRNLRLSGAKQA